MSTKTAHEILNSTFGHLEKVLQEKSRENKKKGKKTDLMPAPAGKKEKKEKNVGRNPR